ncbi:hypothetical protein C8R45DRAFT_1107330 [Mycena sanguinolenta]|nr:hypothetical protein C8R45DRAFT_1107330 [Mycena sanguinolenta]
MSGGLSFPTNINRPQPVGRGERESRPTPGLQNYQAQRERDRVKASKAMETRSRNRTVAGPRASDTNAPPATPAPLPLTPTTNRPPQTPSGILPRRPPPPQSTFPSSSPSPQFFQAPHASSSPAQSPVPARPTASLLPQNYQPSYANFDRLPGSEPPLNTGTGDSASSSSSFTLTPDQFKLMMGQMTHTQRTEFNQILTSMPSDDHRGNLGWDGGSSDNLDDGLSPFDSGNTNDCGSPIGDEHGDPPEPPWNSIPISEVNDEEEGLHDNAQSSLQANVNVQKKKRKRRVQAASDSDVEDSHTTNSRKKRANHNRTSRSINAIDDPEHRLIVKAGYIAIEKAVCLEKPWPIVSPSGDPAAGDDGFENLINDAWDSAVDSLGLEPDFYDTRDTTAVERTLFEPYLQLRGRIPHVRSAIVKEADQLVRESYGFVDIMSLQDCTPENIKTVEEANRQRVAELRGTFMYSDPSDTSDLATMCRHPIFQKLFVACFFAPKGMNRRGFYFDGLDQVPLETMGLLMDAIICGINRWKTGRHTRIDFDAETYGGSGHESSMKFLKAWVAEYGAPLYPVNLAEACRRELLSNARQLSGEPSEEAPPCPSMFPMHVFSNATCQS